MGPVSFTAPRSLIYSNVFNGQATFEKKTTTTKYIDDSFLNNVFNAPAEIINSSSRIIYASSGTNAKEVFNSTVKYTLNSGSPIVIGYNGIVEYNGDVEYYDAVNGSSRVYLSAYGTNYYRANIRTNTPLGIASATSTTVFDGNGDQYIVYTGSSSLPVVTIDKLVMNKSGGKLYLQLPATVKSNMALVKGNIVTSVSGKITLNDNATLTGGSAESFVEGPIVKKGDDAFTFPVGKATIYMPFSMTAPAGTSSSCLAEAFLALPSNAGSISAPLNNISNCQYWNFQSTLSSGTVQVTLPWNSTTCTPVVPSTIAVALFSGTQWVYGGANSPGIDPLAGSITSDARSAFGFLTYGFTMTTNPNNPWPYTGYASLSKNLDGSYYTTINGKLCFKYTEEYIEGELNYRILDSRREVKPVTEVCVKKYGENFYTLDLTDCSYNMIDGKFYTLEVVNDKKEVFAVRFKYERPAGLPGCN